MEYGGDSLASRQTEEGGRVSFTEQERYVVAIFPHLENPRMTITDAFHELHGQGTLHGDIRLNNLLLDSSGAVYIIDFDRADVDVGEKQFKEEMDELADLLDNGDEENNGDKGNPHSI